MKNLGILLSGRGSNFEAIANNVAAGRIPDARIAVVISNREDAGGIDTARRLGLSALVIPSKNKARADHDREVVASLKEHKVDLVCLAGYMRLLSPWFVQQFPRRILNIHPFLLPAFPGLEAQEQAFAYGVKVSGCTVHFVDEELDHGAIIVQKTVPVLDTDDERSLADRILEQEHVAYTEAIRIVMGGRVRVAGRKFKKPEGRFRPGGANSTQLRPEENWKSTAAQWFSGLYRLRFGGSGFRASSVFATRDSPRSRHPASLCFPESGRQSFCASSFRSAR